MTIQIVYACIVAHTRADTVYTDTRSQMHQAGSI